MQRNIFNYIHAETEPLLSSEVSEILLNCTSASFRHITAIQVQPTHPRVDLSWSGYRSTIIAQMNQFGCSHYPGVRGASSGN